jgi:hypothetical protein
MKKLYDEIMALSESSLINDDYNNGFNDAQLQAAELAKKYDDEIERLKNANKSFKFLLNNYKK